MLLGRLCVIGHMEGSSKLNGVGNSPELSSSGLSRSKAKSFSALLTLPRTAARGLAAGSLQLPQVSESFRIGVGCSVALCRLLQWVQ